MGKLSKKDMEELRETCSLGCEYSGTEEIVSEIIYGGLEMYAYIGGISDTDEINNCPFCGEEVSSMHVDGTITTCKRNRGT